MIVYGVLCCLHESDDRDDPDGVYVAVVWDRKHKTRPSPFRAFVAENTFGLRLAALESAVERDTGLTAAFDWTELVTLATEGGTEKAVVFVAKWPTKALQFDYRQSRPVEWCHVNRLPADADPVFQLAVALAADSGFKPGGAIYGYTADRFDPKPAAEQPGGDGGLRPVGEPARGEDSGVPTVGTEAGAGGKPLVESFWGGERPDRVPDGVGGGGVG